MKLHNYFAVSKLFWKRSIYEMSCNLIAQDCNDGKHSAELTVSD